VDSTHHSDEILNFKTDNSHLGSVLVEIDTNCFLGFVKYELKTEVTTACSLVLVCEVIVTNSRLGNCRLLDWTAICSGI